MQEEVPTIIIVGASLGGLTLYHALTKNKDKKEFNVKIFEQESVPKDQWEGYYIGLHHFGVESLIKCIPPSIALNLTKAAPNPIPNKECHRFSMCDHMGNVLLRPPSKQVKDIFEVAKVPIGIIIAYRNKLRDVLLEDVSVQWDKKFTGYEETEEGVFALFEDGSREFCNILVGADGINSSVRKQKIPESKLFDVGLTFVNADVVAPKRIIDRLLGIHDNCIVQKNAGFNGDSSLAVFRLIPIENYKDKNEPHYMTTICFYYPTNSDINAEVDDNDPASVVEHTKQMIQKLSPKCESTDIMLELWNLIPKTSDELEDYPFKTYNSIRRRKMKGFDPSSVKSWTSNRITLLGDAAHAIPPVLGLGANLAIQDAEYLSQVLLDSSSKDYISCIKGYETKMLKQGTAAVSKARNIALRQSQPIGYFGILIRNTILKVVNFMMNAYYYFYV